MTTAGRRLPASAQGPDAGPAVGADSATPPTDVPEQIGTSYDGEGCQGNVVGYWSREICRRRGAKSWKHPNGTCHSPP